MMHFLLALLALSSSPARAADPINVVTTTTDLAWAVKEIGGAHVEVKSLLKGTENPHFVDAVPEFIRLVSEAKVVCLVGLDLEIGWAPKVLSRSGNSQVQPGGKGYCEAGKNIQILERPAGAVNRSMGDVHPSGNPHFWLSPKHFAQAGESIGATLVEVDPAHAADYQAGVKGFVQRLDQIQKKQTAKLRTATPGATAPLLMEYHKEFAYFMDVYGLKSHGSIEEKPGVAPSAGRLAEVAINAKAAGIRAVLASDTAPRKTLDRFKELSGVPIIQVPLSVQPGRKIKDYEQLQEVLVDSVIKALSSPKT